MDKSKTSWTDDEFDQMSWHDNHVHSLRVVEGKFGTGSLILDLDYILEWKKGEQIEVEIAPVDLEFYEVSSLRIMLDYEKVSAALVPFSIQEIKRSIEKRDRYNATVWSIELNWPVGKLEFESTGFIQQCRANPQTSSNQYLDAKSRKVVT